MDTHVRSSSSSSSSLELEMSTLQKQNNELSSRIKNERKKNFVLTVGLVGIAIHFWHMNISMVHTSQFHSMQESIQDMSMVHNSRFQSMQDTFIEILPGEVANQVGAGRDTIKELKERLGNETSKVDACEANNTSLMETHQEQLKAAIADHQEQFRIAIAEKDGLLKSMMKEMEFMKKDNKKEVDEVNSMYVMCQKMLLSCFANIDLGNGANKYPVLPSPTTTESRGEVLGY